MCKLSSSHFPEQVTSFHSEQPHSIPLDALLVLVLLTCPLTHDVFLVTVTGIWSISYLPGAFGNKEGAAVHF